MDLNTVIEKGFVPGIQEVGDLWDRGEYFLPELITSAECMKEAMGILQPELEKANIQARSQGKVVIGTIEGNPEILEEEEGGEVHAQARLNRAEVNLTTGDYAAAKAEIEEVRAAHPDHVYAQILLERIPE